MLIERLLTSKSGRSMAVGLVLLLIGGLALGPVGEARHASANPETSLVWRGQGAEKSSAHARVDSVLAQLLLMAQQGSVSSQAVQQEASRAGIPIRGDKVRVVAETSRPASALLAIVSQLAGGVVRAQSRNFIELEIPLSNSPLVLLLQLADLSGIAYLRAPLSPQALTVSEGVSATGARTFHGNGVRGRGTTIAVIDLGFAGLSQAQSRGELPSNLRSLDLSGTGLQSTTTHGTAVAEIVHDMAPEAELVLIKIADEVDFENAVDRAIQMGVDIINHSVGWFNTNFYDGTGPIDAAVQRARSAGILWVNAAGNYAQRHWQGTATDSDNDRWVEFSTGREGLSFNVRRGQPIEVFLTWRDWPTTSQDYDLLVANGSGAVVASSVRVQNGTQPPTEHLVFSAPSSDTYQIRVRAANVGSPRRLALFNMHQDLTPSVALGSIVAPAEADSALAVGAVHFEDWTTGPIEPYSSRGPTTDGRAKPDIVGPDQVSISTAAYNPFVGTSAAAPHVAGAAALLLSEDRSLTVNRLENRLTGEAIPMGSSTVFGSGRLNLAPSTQPTRRADLTVRNAGVSPRNPRVGDILTVTAQVLNQGGAPAGPFAVQLSDSAGTVSRNFSGLPAGDSLDIRFQRQLHTSETTITLTVDPFGQVSESDEGNNSAQLSVSAQSQPTLGIDVRTDRTRYQIGDPIRVELSTGADGFVYVYDVDAQGRVNLLFPPWEGGNAFLRGGDHSLADLLGASRLEVSGPTGQEHIHAIIASRSVRLGLDGRRNGSYTDPNAFRSAVSQRIGSAHPSVNWAWDAAGFQIGSAQPGNQPPTARFSFDPREPVVNETVVFDGSSSSDPDGAITDWHWIFEGNNRTELRGSRQTVRFASARTFRVTLTVTDDEGATDSTTQLVDVRSSLPSNRAPVARFSFSPSNPQVSETITYDGRRSSDPDGRIVRHRWDLNGDGRTDTTGSVARARYSRAGSYRVTLTVYDDDGRSSSTSQTVEVREPTQPPEDGELPRGPGFFIRADRPDRFQIIVQGDPSWTESHSYGIILRMVSTSNDLHGFTGVEAEVKGNADVRRIDEDRSQPTLSGSVKDGRIVYTIGVRNPRALLFFLTMDMDGDGSQENGTRRVPVFVSVGGTYFRVQPPRSQHQLWLISGGRSNLLPFRVGGVFACGEDASYCVPVQ